jgi:hypothetical protein
VFNHITLEGVMQAPGRRDEVATYGPAEPAAMSGHDSVHPP